MHFASVFEDMAPFKGWAEEDRLRMQTLGIGGEIAACGYGAMALKALADNVHGAVIAGPGHWIAEEQPAALTACLIDFLQGA